MEDIALVYERRSPEGMHRVIKNPRGMVKSKVFLARPARAFFSNIIILYILRNTLTK